MGKHKNTTHAGRGVKRDTILSPLSYGGEPEDTIMTS